MFFSPDSFIQSPGDWMNYNQYSYVMNNPTRSTDPTGYVMAEKNSVWFAECGYGGALGGGNEYWKTSTPWYARGAITYDWANGNYEYWNGDEDSEDAAMGKLYNGSTVLGSWNGGAATSVFSNIKCGVTLYRFDFTSGYTTYAACIGDIGTLTADSRGGIASCSNPTFSGIGKEWVGNESGESGGGNFDNSNLALDIGGGIYGGLRTVVTHGDQWLGSNGKYYNKSWGGNQYAGSRSGAFAASNSYKWAGRVTVGATVIIGGIQVYNGYQMDEGQFGYNTNLAGAGATGGIIGGWAGAKAGASIGFAFGVWFGGVGAVPGTIIGGFVGGIAGSLIGNKVGESSVNYYYGR